MRFFKGRGRRALALLAGAAVAVMFVPGVAFGDDVSNTLDGTIDAASETMPLRAGGPNGTTSLFIRATNTDGKKGCNLTPAKKSSPSLVVSVSSSNSSVATVNPSTITFKTCKDKPTVTVTPVAGGTANITITQASNNTGGTFDLRPATFTVNVSAPPPPPNTPPVLTFPNPAVGQPFDGVLTVEANDGSGGWTPSNYQVTASDAQDGVLPVTCVPVSTTESRFFYYGQTTVHCSVTDSGGLTDEGTLLVQVVDHTPPVLTLPNDITVPATNADGALVDYTATAHDLGFGDLGDNHNEPWGPVHCTPLAGSVFPVGTTTVTCNADDPAGVPTTGNFTVSVQAPPPPSSTGLSGNVSSRGLAGSAPAAGLQVVITNSPDGGTEICGQSGLPDCPVTDAAGNWTFDLGQLPANGSTYKTSVSGNDGCTVYSGQTASEATAQQVHADPGSTISVNMVLDCGTIHGLLFDQDPAVDAPARNVNAIVTDVSGVEADYAHQITGTDGLYSVKVPAGTYKVKFRSQCEGLPGCLLTEWFADWDNVVGATPVLVTPGGSVEVSADLSRTHVS